MISALSPSNVEEDINMGTSIISNLDTVREPRVLTIDFEARYGNYSGGQMIAVTKSGHDRFHADCFEFLRKKKLDICDLFSPGRAKSGKNPFGDTLGSPAFGKRVSDHAPRLVHLGIKVLC